MLRKELPIDPSDIPELKFQGIPGFMPHYTPKDMLLLGVFGGTFFNSLTMRRKLPPELFEGVPPENFESRIPNGEINCFKELVSKRNRQGNIPYLAKMVHPGGWYHWYCHFYYGSRNEFDGFRVNEWRQEVATLYHYIKFGSTGDPLLVAYRQQLLHYGWDHRINPLDKGIRL